MSDEIEKLKRALAHTQEAAAHVEDERDRLRERCETLANNHEHRVEEMAALRKERDEALVRCERLRELADAAASEQGLAQRRMMDAQREHTRAQARLIDAALIHADLVRERDEARAEVANAFRRGAEAMRLACQEWCIAWENNGEAIAEALADLRVEDKP